MTWSSAALRGSTRKIEQLLLNIGADNPHRDRTDVLAHVHQCGLTISMRVDKPHALKSSATTDCMPASRSLQDLRIELQGFCANRTPSVISPTYHELRLGLLTTAGKAKSGVSSAQTASQIVPPARIAELPALAEPARQTCKEVAA